MQCFAHHHLELLSQKWSCHALQCGIFFTFLWGISFQVLRLKDCFEWRHFIIIGLVFRTTFLCHKMDASSIVTVVVFEIVHTNKKWKRCETQKGMKTARKRYGHFISSSVLMGAKDHVCSNPTFLWGTFLQTNFFSFLFGHSLNVVNALRGAAKTFSKENKMEWKKEKWKNERKQLTRKKFLVFVKHSVHLILVSSDEARILMNTKHPT